MYHIRKQNWLYTSNGDPRGYIQPQLLRELWFHTGSACNLSCSFCLEGSQPGDKRIEPLTFEDAKPFIDEAIELNVEKFSFTGGEPFVIRDIIKILGYALEHRSCLVLTNGTNPLIKRMPDIFKLQDKPHSLSFRISLDYPDSQKHDAGRGEGNFEKALQTLAQLNRSGFRVSVARREISGKKQEVVNQAYRSFFASVGLPLNIPITVFPEYFLPCFHTKVPQITETCMTTYKDQKSRSEFMCNYSKMVLKQSGKMAVYACTLVDDEPDFNLGTSLSGAMKLRVMLKHHRCFTCFSHGASCSEL